MTVEKFLESKETYNKVIEILSKRLGTSIYGAPSTIIDDKDVDNVDGFIAGGCVANVLNFLRHNVTPVINDIDIFYFFENKKGEWVNGELDDFPETIETGISIGGDWYGNRWIQPNGDFSIMKSHTRNGIFNYIKIHVGSRNESVSREQIVLKGFDLNGCQAGIDIKNKKLVYTDNFVKFLKSRQLMVTIPINPLQTVIRMTKKIKDLDCYCDTDNEFKLLQYALFSNKVADRFGQETYDKYLEYKEVVDSLFDVFEYKEPKKRVLTDMFGPVDNGSSDVSEDRKLWAFTPKIDKYELPYEFNHPLELTNYWRMVNNGIGDNKIRKYNRIIKKIYSNGIGEEGHNRFNMKGKESVVKGKLGIYKTHEIGKDYYKNIRLNTEIESINHSVWHFMVLNEKYYDCDFHVKHIDYIENFMSNHQGIRRVFEEYEGLNLQKHHNFIKVIKTFVKQRGEWVIGELENIPHKDLTELNTTLDKTEWLNEFFNKLEKKLSKKLIDPIDISGFEYNNCVKELITTLELRSEGTKMGHCVGGYSSSISSGDSRIFHIDCDGIGSTLQINTGRMWAIPSNDRRDISEEWKKFANDDDVRRYKELDYQVKRTKFRVSQHNGRYPEKGNMEPTKTNKDIAGELTEYLNKMYLKPILTDLLWERHLIEEKINKDVKDKRTGKEIPSYHDIW